MRVLFYAVNGKGLGHVTRTLAIARQVRALEPRSEILFLTSSEAEDVIYREGFAAVKVPSKTIRAETRLRSGTYSRLVEVVTWNTVAGFNPHVMVVDTFPAGSIHELLPVLRWDMRKVFIFRAQRQEHASGALLQNALHLYDRVIVPHAEGEEEIPVPEEIEVTWAGPILIRGREEALGRDEARQALGLPAEGRLVYATFGGGGDEEIAASVRATAEACGRLARAGLGVHLVVACGPLFRGGVGEAGTTDVRSVAPGRAEPTDMKSVAPSGYAAERPHGRGNPPPSVGPTDMKSVAPSGYAAERPHGRGNPPPSVGPTDMKSVAPSGYAAERPHGRSNPPFEGRSAEGSEQRISYPLDLPITWLEGRYPMASYLRAFDAAVAATGYNTASELVHHGIPSLFIPYPRQVDDQEARAARIAAAGAGLTVPRPEADAIERALRKLLDPGTAERIRAAAEALIPENGAVRAARAILETP